MTTWKRRALCAALAGCVVLAGCSEAENAENENTLFHQGLLAVELDRKWGYIDESGKYVINPQFSEAADFNSKGFAFVTISDPYHKAVINTKGETVIDEIDYDYWGGIQSDDLVIAGIEGKYGYIDKTYSWVIEPKFDKAYEFNENGLALVSTGGTLQEDGRYYGSQFGLIDKKGNFVIKPEFDQIYYYHYNKEESLNAVVDGKVGVIDADGKWIIEPMFDQGSAYSFGAFELAAVQIDHKWGFVDKNGDFSISPQFDSAENFSEDGLAAVRIDEKWGYIDLSGKFLIEPQFDYAIDFETGTAFVEMDNKWGLINTQGEYIYTPRFTDISTHEKNGLTIVEWDEPIEAGGFSTNRSWGVMNAKGEFLTKPECSYATFYGDSFYKAEYNTEGYSNDVFNIEGSFVANEMSDSVIDGIRLIRVDQKYGYIDEQGNRIIEPQYDRAEDFNEDGYAKVGIGLINTQWGIIDKSGNYVVRPQFQLVSEFFGDGLAAVRLNDKWGWVDTEGNYVLNPQFDEISGFTDNGRASVLLNGKWGYIDIVSEEWIVEPIYEGNICQFYDDGYAVLCEDGSLCGIVDYEGNYIINPQFNNVNKYNISYRWYHLE